MACLLEPCLAPSVWSPSLVNAGDSIDDGAVRDVANSMPNPETSAYSAQQVEAAIADVKWRVRPFYFICST